MLVGEGVATASNHEQAVERLVKAGARVKASEQTPLASHEGPYFGQFGGRYVPEALITALDELERVYEEAKADPEFQPAVCRSSVTVDRCAALCRASEGKDWS